MQRPLNISTAEAAKLMEKNPLFVREGMKRGEIEIGTAMQMPGSAKWNFYISPPALAHYLGVSLDALGSMIEDIRGREAVKVG